MFEVYLDILVYCYMLSESRNNIYKLTFIFFNSSIVLQFMKAKSPEKYPVR